MDLLIDLDGIMYKLAVENHGVLRSEITFMADLSMFSKFPGTPILLKMSVEAANHFTMDWF